MSEIEYDAGEEFYEPEAAPPQGGLVSFAQSFVEQNDSAQRDLDSLVRSEQILTEEYANAPADQYDDDGSDFYDEGEQLDPFSDNFQAQVGDYVDQRLAGLGAFDPDPLGRAAWNQQREVLRQEVAQQQEAEALARGSELAVPLMQEHDLRNHPVENVLAGANALVSHLSAADIAGMPDWQREQLAAEAIRLAVVETERGVIAGNVLSRFGKRGGR